MNNQLVKTLMVEIDGSVEKLRRALKDGESGLKDFEQKSTRTGAASGAASDVVSTKQANAARAIAMTTETISRQGAVSGETAKQLIAQASNIGFAFGPTGAIVGAIGIATLAIVAMFTRARREMQETMDKGREAAIQFSEMDAVGQARSLNRLRQGVRDDDGVESVEKILDRPRDQQDKLFRDRGLNRLEQDETRLAQELTVAYTTVPLAEYRKREAALARLRDVIGLLSEEYDRNTVKLSENAAATARQNQEGLQREAATRSATEAARAATKAADEKERERDKKHEASLRARKQREERLIAEQEAMHVRLRSAIREGLHGTDEDVRQAFDELAKHAREDGGVEVSFLERLRDQALDLNAAMRQSTSLLDKLAGADLKERILASSNRDRTGPDESEIVALEAVRTRIERIAADTARSEKDRRAAKAEVLKLQAEIERRIGATTRARQQDTKELRQQALAIGQAIDGVLQMAGAWGGVRREVLDVLRGIVQIASNVPGITEGLSNLKSAKAGGGKFTDATGTVITSAAAAASVAAAALPIIGALSTIGASMFSRSPEEQERKRIQRDNTEAIKQLTERVGSSGINLGGSELLEGGAEAQRVLRGVVGADGTRAVFAQLDRAINAVGGDKALLDRVARELGVTLSDSTSSLEQLIRAIEATEGKLGEFGDSLEDQTAVNDVLIDAKQITDPIARLTAQLGPAMSLSPLLKQLLENADLTTAEGRDALRAQVIAILETMKFGGEALSPEEMGISRDQLLQIIQQILGGLGDIEANVPNAGSSLGGISGFRGLTEAAGERMADYLRGLYASSSTAESQRAQMIAHLAELNFLAKTPLSVPTLPSTAAALASARVAGAGAFTVEIASIHLGGIVIHLDREDGVDGETIAQAALSSFAREVERVVYDAILRAKREAGDLSVTRTR